MPPRTSPQPPVTASSRTSRSSRSSRSREVAPAAAADQAGSTGWVLYGRVSSEEQLLGTSLANQKEICLAWLVSQGHRVHRVILDEAASGKDLDRPGMRQLLADVAAGMVQGVVVAKLDRLSRSLRDTLHLIDLFDAQQVKFACVRDPIDTSSASGRVFFQIRSAFAEFERGCISERQTSSIAHRKSLGLFTGGVVPLGMRAIGPQGGRKLEVDPVTGPVLARCWVKLLEGASLRDLAAYLTSERIPTRWNVPWSITTVSGLFHRGYARGTLVDAELYDRALAKLDARWSPTRAKRGPLTTEDHSPPNGATERIWPLQGVGRCLLCGSALVGTHGNGRGGRYYYLTCNGRQRRGTDACAAKPLAAAHWEAAVLRTINWLAGEEALLMETLARYARERQNGVEPARERQRALMPERDRLIEERDRLIEVAKQGSLVARAIAAALGDVQTKLDVVETALADVMTTLHDATLGDGGIETVLQDLREGLAILRTASEADRNLILHEFVPQIHLANGMPMTLHLRLPDSPRKPIKKIVPPNLGSEGRTVWCAGQDSNLHESYLASTSS